MPYLGRSIGNNTPCKFHYKSLAIDLKVTRGFVAYRWSVGGAWSGVLVGVVTWAGLPRIRGGY